jgi:ubiquinone/menaquinone biosynthesis C-methylase UbiE
MAQNIYDTPKFFEGYSRLPRSIHGLDGAPEWPDIRALLPDLNGKRVVDLGCGFGWFARWARQHGAAHALGLDLSRNMLERARADTRDSGIEYRIADLESLELPERSFELAYSSLAFHYVADFARLMQTVHRALVKDAHLVFSIEHPVYMAAAQPQWTGDAGGCKTWPVNNYSREGVRTTDWLANGVVKYHRTMATTLNTLLDTGFAVRRVVEFAPSAEQIAAAPQLAEEMERPMMLIIAAQRMD